MINITKENVNGIVITEIIKALRNLPQGSDFSDIGNILGFIINDNKLKDEGFQVEDFKFGINHGLSS